MPDEYGFVRYEYKMIQMPSTVDVAKEHRKQRAAHYLEDLANEQATDGWEFQRIDKVGMLTTPGFFARLVGVQSVHTEYNVVTFRRALYEQAIEPDDAAA